MLKKEGITTSDLTEQVEEDISDLEETEDSDIPDEDEQEDTDEEKTE